MWPFKTTIAFRNDDGGELRLTYAVSAGDMIEAKCELERRFEALGIFGYTIADNHRRHEPRSQSVQLAGRMCCLIARLLARQALLRTSKNEGGSDECVIWW